MDGRKSKYDETVERTMIFLKGLMKGLWKLYTLTRVEYIVKKRKIFFTEKNSCQNPKNFLTLQSCFSRVYTVLFKGITTKESEEKQYYQRV